METVDYGLETKFARLEDGLSVGDGSVIEGYASLFDTTDRGGDVVQSGAYGRSLKALSDAGRRVKMLWQHDPAQPIGVWDEIREDAKGLYVRGRILDAVEKGREAKALIEAGAIDGLSIGYRTIRATKNEQGLRLLSEVELWEVSLVTFPMLPQARLGASRASGTKGDLLSELATVFETARRNLAAREPR
ncbi:HK97 family phage prohead protease [Rhodobacterales bacterium HKCCE2091]|nr:HK97 family phage prohead protease [Rhodobacterales bacterium HKCCE2091]